MERVIYEFADGDGGCEVVVDDKRDSVTIRRKDKPMVNVTVASNRGVLRLSWEPSAARCEIHQNSPFGAVQIVDRNDVR